MIQHHTIPLDDGKVLAFESFVPVLRANGLDTFERVMAEQSGAVVRAVPGRSTVQLQLAEGHGPPLVCYLKRYETGYLSRWKFFWRAIHWPGADDEAARECQKILLLRQHGFLTAAPVALGQRRCCGVVTASFLLQQEIVGGAPADEFILQRLRGAPPRRKWQLLERIGKLAAAFHGAGFIHKDLYLKHIFVVERGDTMDLFLIDLQRVVGPRRHRWRWYLKDLGALAHSALFQTRLSRTNLLRLYIAYTGVKKLRREDREMISKILRRVRQFQKRLPKYRRIWNAPPPSLLS
ncbi:MAG: hypothetical protein HY298_26580 [Verrucomicrobia bacterium]|nr:hypothetical protein [Verrucomicrobiota bacterium]